MRRLGLQRVPAHLWPLALTAILLGLCFPHPGWGILAHVALAPAAVVALRAESVRRLMWTSYVVSFCWWLVMLRWLIPVTGGGVVMLAAFKAIYLPASLLVYRRLRQRWGVPSALALPMAWVAFELVRSHWPAGGMAWFVLGHSQAPYAPDHGVSYLIQIADVFGDYGVSFVVAMSNGVIVDALTLPWRQPRPGGERRLNRTIALGLALWAFAMVASIAYGHHRVKDTDAHAQTLNVAVIQTNVPQSNKDSQSSDQIEAYWQALLEQTHRAAQHDPPPQVIVWPETITPGAVNPEARQMYRSQASWWRKTTPDQLEALPDAQNLRALARQLNVPWAQLPAQMVGYFDLLLRCHDDIVKMAQQHKTPLLIGGPWVSATVTTRHNSVYAYQRDGKQSSRRYDKMYRVPFGEYIPWVEAWPHIKHLFIKYLTPYDRDYTLTPGDRPVVFTIDSVRLATPICFEDTAAWLCRRMCYGRGGQKLADVLVNVTNDGWFRPVERPQHLQIAVFRSIENRVSTARSVNTGVSGFISSVGRIGPIVGVGQANHLIAPLRIDRRQTVFGRIGHSPAAVMAVLAVVLSLIPGFRRRVR